MSHIDWRKIPSNPGGRRDTLPQPVLGDVRPGPYPGTYQVFVPNPYGLRGKGMWSEPQEIPRGYGDGGEGRTQFPSERGVDEATIANLTEQTRLLGPEYEQSRLDSQTANYLDSLDLQLRAELGRGNLKALADQFGVDTRTLAETIRANQAREAENAKQRAADAAQEAVTAYLKATELSDARRLAAIQEQRALLPSMVDPNQEFWGGMEPGGALATAMGGMGLPFTPSRIQHTTMDPASLAQAAPPDPSVMEYINRIQQQGTMA